MKTSTRTGGVLLEMQREVIEPVTRRDVPEWVVPPSTRNAPGQVLVMHRLIQCKCALCYLLSNLG